jgi:hypothetical protein
MLTVFKQNAVFCGTARTSLMEVGVARPRAQGQVMARTAINFSSASAKFPESPPIYQMKNVIKAIPTTIGTKIPDIVSAKR